MDILDSFMNAGDDIMNTVSDAAKSGDFSHLSEDIRRAVKQAEMDIKGAAGSASGAAARYSAEQRTDRSGAQRQGVNWFLQRKVDLNTGLGGKIGGIAGSIVFAGIAAFMLLGALAFFVVGPAGGGVALLIAGLVLGGISYAFYRMFRRNRDLSKLVKTYYQYGNELGDSEYFAVADLARGLVVPESEVRDNLEKMMKEGFLPFARFDETKTTVMLSDRALKQYQQALLSKQQREAEERKKKMQESYQKGGSFTAASKAAGEAAKADEEPLSEAAGAGKDNTRSGENAAGTNPEADALLREGREYIRKIRIVNDAIPDSEEMSSKLYRLENVVARIFGQVQKNPSSAKDLRKLMNYYLPTTAKLLDSYVELYHLKSSGENVRESMKEIEDATDIVNDAFENFLDKMFESKAIDISTDIDVMTSMLKQDGLAEVEKPGV